MNARVAAAEVYEAGDERGGMNSLCEFLMPPPPVRFSTVKMLPSRGETETGGAGDDIGTSRSRSKERPEGVLHTPAANRDMGAGDMDTIRLPDMAPVPIPRRRSASAATDATRDAHRSAAAPSPSPPPPTNPNDANDTDGHVGDGHPLLRNSDDDDARSGESPTGTKVVGSRS